VRVCVWDIYLCARSIFLFHHWKPRYSSFWHGEGCTSQLRFEEVEELWSDFQDVVGALYHEPTVVAKMEGKLKRGFTESAMRSGMSTQSSPEWKHE